MRSKCGARVRGVPHFEHIELLMMGWQMSDVTTNIWNMQAFNEENANLFVILFIKGLLVRTNVRT